MASIAPSKWSMSVHGDDRWMLTLKLHTSRFYYILSVPIIALYALILCGCISKAPTIPTIFLAELRDTSASSTTRLRFGYFGICASNDSSSFKCSSSVLSSPSALASSLSTTPKLMFSATNLQQSISFFTPSIASIIFLFGLLNLGTLQFLIFARRRKLSFVVRKENCLDIHIHNLVLASRCLLWGSCAVCLASAQAMHAAVRMLAAASSNLGINGITKGGTMEAMLWSTVAITLMFNVLMEFSTADIPSTRPRARKSTPLPFTDPNPEAKYQPQQQQGDATRSDSIRKITTATAQRLALVGMHSNMSQQTVATTIDMDGKQRDLVSPSTIDSPLTPGFQAVNSPGLYPPPPLATLQRRPTNPRLNTPTGQHNKSSPLSQALGMPVPNSPFRSAKGPSLTERRQERPGNVSAVGMRRIEIRQPPPVRPERGMRIERLGPLSPGLQGILRNGLGGGRASTVASSVYSRQTESPREKKGFWV